MTPTIARIKLQLAAQYLSDLEKLAAGDEGRFGRMVDGKGKGIGSKQKWEAMVRNILTTYTAHHPQLASKLISRADKLGITKKEQQHV